MPRANNDRLNLNVHSISKRTNDKKLFYSLFFAASEKSNVCLFLESSAKTY